MLETKRRTKIISIIANLFFNLGNFNMAEECYSKYIKLVEEKYGKDSLETSNCYFLVGIFYLDNKCFKRSIACTKKALILRMDLVGFTHPSISDCYVNMALALKLAGYSLKAKAYLNIALEIRSKKAIEQNLRDAKVFSKLIRSMISMV